MRKLILFSILFFWTLTDFGQGLTASIALVEKPHCRTADYQSGNGVLTCFASGGQPDYTFAWYDSNFNLLNNNSTLVIRSVGMYYLSVVDANNQMFLDSIVVTDSISPKAIFEIQSDDFYSTSPFEAYDKAEVKLVNLAPPDFLLPPEYNDTLYCWTFEHSNSILQRYYTSRADQEIDTLLNRVGTHDICLVTKNYNNCRDTSCQEISIVSSLVLDSETPVVVFPNYNSQTIQFHSKDFSELHFANIYSVSGKLIKRFTLGSPIQTVNFNSSKGVYVYAITLEDKTVASGKFVFGL